VLRDGSWLDEAVEIFIIVDIEAFVLD